MKLKGMEEFGYIYCIFWERSILYTAVFQCRLNATFFQRDPSFLKKGKKAFGPPLPIHHIPSTSLLSPCVVWPVKDHTSVMVKQHLSVSCLVWVILSVWFQETWVRSMYVYSHVCILARRKHIYFDTGRHWLILLKNLKVEGSLLSLQAEALCEPALARHTSEPGRPDSVRPLSQGRPVFLRSLKTGLKRWLGTVLPWFLRPKVFQIQNIWGELGITYWKANFFA